MGAHTFGHTVAVKGNERDAYRALVQEATETYGTDSYNGTISTTSGCTAPIGKANTAKAAHKIADTILNAERNSHGIEKWGKAGVVELTGNGADVKRAKEFFGMKGRRGVRVFFIFGWAAS